MVFGLDYLVILWNPKKNDAKRGADCRDDLRRLPGTSVYTGPYIILRLQTRERYFIRSTWYKYTKNIM